ncbi:MAG: hypothetical protein ACE5GK_01770 [Nitrospiria bacterium]
MKDNDKTDPLIASAKDLLNQAQRELDSVIVSRLRHARQQALDAHADKDKTRSPWLIPASGIVLACAGALVFFLWLRTPPPMDAGVGIEDLDLLTADESLEFYQDLEFYAWLSEADREG